MILYNSQTGLFMLVYHFINKEYGIEDLRKRRLKIATLNELNDPFEFFGGQPFQRSSSPCLSKDEK